MKFMWQPKKAGAGPNKAPWCSGGWRHCLRAMQQGHRGPGWDGLWAVTITNVSLHLHPALNLLGSTDQRVSGWTRGVERGRRRSPAQRPARGRASSGHLRRALPSWVLKTSKDGHCTAC